MTSLANLLQSLSGASCGEATISPADALKPSFEASSPPRPDPHQNSNEYEFSDCAKQHLLRQAERPRLFSDDVGCCQPFFKALQPQTPNKSEANTTSFTFSEHSSVFIPQQPFPTANIKTDSDASGALSSSQSCYTSTPADFKLKERTEICRNWQLNKCRFGDKCAFAHGTSQLLKKTHVDRKYKVTKCRSFHAPSRAFCMYGSRCQFAHLVRDSCTNYQQVLEENARQMRLKVECVEWPDLAQFNVAAPKMPRLPIFKQMTASERGGGRKGK